MSLRGILYRNKTIFNFFKKNVLRIRFIKSFFSKIQDRDLCIIEPKKIIHIYSSEYHYFYGYYNQPAFSANDELIVFHQIEKKFDFNIEAKIQLYNLKTNSIEEVTETNAWNFQQGSMVQFKSNSNEVIYFNNYDSDIGYHTVEYNISSNEHVKYPRPFYVINSFSNYLSLNFERLQEYAVGYGYLNKSGRPLDDDNDGIWFGTLNGSEPKLIITINQLKKFFKDDENRSAYVNHLEFIPNSDDFIFIYRYLKEDGTFYSRLVKYDSLKAKLIPLIDNYGHVSHFCWENENTLFIYTTNNYKKRAFYFLDINSGRLKEFCCNSMKEDGHPSFNKDNRYLINDTYPNEKRFQYLYLYDFEMNICYDIDKLRAPIKYFDEFRCDLHPRWSNNGKYILIDTTERGLRGLKLYKLF